MVTKKANPTARIFAVKADLGTGDEIGLHDILTWRTLTHATAFCAGKVAGVSSRVVIAERGSSFEGGMSITIGERGVWSVQLGDDRMVSPLKEGEVLSVLESDYRLVGKTRLWQLRASVIGHVMVTPQETRFVAASLGVQQK